MIEEKGIDDEQASDLPEDMEPDGKSAHTAGNGVPDADAQSMSASAIAAMRARKDREERERKTEAEAHKLGLQAKLQRLDVGERAKHARGGDQETRMILIRDSNKLVALGVLQNPKLTLHEIEMFAASRNVNEEILREIAGNKDWIKSYSVILALVNNPKTPVPMCLTFLSKLMTRDLRFVARNKGVPEVIRTTAKRLSNRRSF